MRLMWSCLLPAAMCAAVSAAEPPPTEVSRQVDALVHQGCTSAGITPLGRCTDPEFLRRVWLDLAGRIPPVSEVAKLTADHPLDRGRVVDELLKSPEFARHWGRVWAEYLTDRRPFDGADYDARRLMQYLTEACRQNVPYDRLIGELIDGDGTSDVSGPANFLLRYNADPIPLAGAVSQKFLGLSLQCAECHDHPHAAWKQKDFWGLAAHFARLRKMTPTNPPPNETFFVVIERPRGELIVPDKRAKADENGAYPSKTIYPQLPGAARSDPFQPRRELLVAWLTDRSNPYVGRHLVNVLWQRFFGERLIHNFDQWSVSPATTETALLDLLATDFTSHGFDVQRLIQALILSDTYQRSSLAADATESKIEPRQLDLASTHWARARIRPLTADQLHLSIAQAFGYHFDENDFRLAEATNEEFTYDLPVNSFGPTPLTLGRSLAMYNSDHVRGAAEFGAEAMVRLHGQAAGAEHINRLFQSLLSRRPTLDELEFFQDLGGENDPRAGLQDVIWVLLNSTEFVTNH